MDLTDAFFETLIDKNGYEVKPDECFVNKISHGPMMIWGKSTGHAPQYKKVKPLELSRDLLAELAAVKLDEERSILDWCERYGFLFSPPETRTHRLYGDRFAIPLKDFKDAVKFARAYVSFNQVWGSGRDKIEKLFTEDTDEDLGQLWHEENELTGVLYRDLFWGEDGEWRPVPRISSLNEPKYDLSDYSLLAERVLWRHLEDKLSGIEGTFTYPPTGRGVGIATFLGDDRRFQRLYLAPRDLFSAACLQASMLLHADKIVKTCPLCSETWIEDRINEGKPKFHNTQVRCGSESCNVQANRKRKSLAMSQAVETRRSVEEIHLAVNSLGLGSSKVGTVRRWVEAARNG